VRIVRGQPHTSGVCRATGVYVFAYAVYFFWARTDMSGLLQTLQYFGYTALLAYAIGLTLACVSFVASRRFVYYIYANVKTD
jgi:transmembrane 9 superfamily protein 1